MFVSSTWGPKSLYSRTPSLIQRLRAELPLDEYTVAVALHPNAWSAHSPWQIRRWLDACVRAGVILVPAETGWQAGLVAADLVVGDHGSVTFYAAALGKPVLLATSPIEAVDPDSAVGRFLGVADHLDTGAALAPQVAQAVARGQSTDQRETAALVTSVPFKAFSLLREELYRLMALAEPEHPAITPTAPAPRIETRTPAAQAVLVLLSEQDGVPRAEVTRFAADLVARGIPPAPGSHLVVNTDVLDQTLLQLADIIVRESPGDAATWITRTLNALPGATLASAPVDNGTWLVGTRDGRFLEFAPAGRYGRVWASVVLTWLNSGKPIELFPAEVELKMKRSSLLPISSSVDDEVG